MWDFRKSQMTISGLSQDLAPSGPAICNHRLRVSLTCRSLDYSVPFSKNFWHSSVRFVHTQNMDSAPSGNPTRSWTRLDGVDLLRALAIFFVLMNHVNIRLLHAKVPYLNGLPHQLVNSLVWNGQLGVQIFFAVSGFLITSTTLRRWGALSRCDTRWPLCCRRRCWSR